MDRLYACIDAAYPEGEVPLRPGERRQPRPKPGQCSGLIAENCGARRCEEREARAWLALARQHAQGMKESGRPPGNRKVYDGAVASLTRQAFAICRAAAANSAWGVDQVAKGTYKPALSHPCAREAIAGMVIPMLGHARGN